MNNTIIDIAEGAAASVDVRVGTTIRVVRGKVWLTQEDDSRDYCVCPGITFCADRKGRVVLGAVGGPIVAIVTPPDARGIAQTARGPLRIESVAWLVREAKRAQADAIARMFWKLCAAVLPRLRRARRVRRLRTAIGASSTHPT